LRLNGRMTFDGKNLRELVRNDGRMRDLDRRLREHRRDAPLEHVAGGFGSFQIGAQNMVVESDDRRADGVPDRIGIPDQPRMSAHRHSDGIGPRRCDINHAQLPQRRHLVHVTLEAAKGCIPLGRNPIPERPAINRIARNGLQRQR